MPYKRIEDRRKRDRERKRAARRGVVCEVVQVEHKKAERKGATGATKPSAPGGGVCPWPEGASDPPTAREILLVLAGEIRVVVEIEGDPLGRARTVSTLCGAYLKGLETAEIEARVYALEALLAGKGA